QVGEGITGEIAAERETAAAQASDGARSVLLVSSDRPPTLQSVVAASPGEVAGIIELIRNIALVVEIVVSEGGQRDIGERQRGSAFELRSGQWMVNAELRVVALLIAIRAALHELRAGKRSPEIGDQPRIENVRPV